jgi:histidine triad (HIT) family protein
MAKEECILCQIIDGKIPSKKLYEDDEVIAVLDINGANPGHSFVMPKEHHTILEQVPDQIVAELFQVSNMVSTAIFESLEIQGTNLFVTNGIAAGQVTAHFMVNIIPRKEGDGINLQWPPKQLTEEEMSTVELQLKEGVENMGAVSEVDVNEKAEKEAVNEVPVNETIPDEDDYMVKQLNRIP